MYTITNKSIKSKSIILCFNIVFHFAGDEMKKKWKNIKDSYQKYLRTVNNRTGKTIKRSYRNWQWAKEMEFLRSQTESNINDIDNSSNTENQKETLNSPVVTTNEDSGSFEENPLQDIASYHRNKRKRISKEVAVPVAQSTDYHQPQKQQVISTDATDLIFLGYSNTVKTFSPMRQAIVKMRIAQIMMEEELHNLEETTQTTVTNNASQGSQESASYDNQACSSSTFLMKMEEPEPY